MFLSELFNEQKLSAQDISADEGGLGIAMCDRLAENGWHVRRVNNGSPSSKPDAYASIASEMWFESRTAIEKQQIILPNDWRFAAGRCSRKRRKRSSRNSPP